MVIELKSATGTPLAMCLVLWTIQWTIGCNYYFNAIPDAGSDTSTDSDDTCDAPICISRITGTVGFENGEGVPGSACVKVCWRFPGSEGCQTITTGEKGFFSFETLGDGSWGFDFSNGDYIHLSIFWPDAEQGINSYARYIVDYAPTPAEIGKDGSFDTGDHVLYKLNGDTATYTPKAGVQIDGTITGVVLDIGPSELGSVETTVSVTKIDLSKWEPPFLRTLNPDALYYLAPYFRSISGETKGPHYLDIQFDPKSVKGWGDAEDTGIIYMLGDAIGSDGGLECLAGAVASAELGICDESVGIAKGMINARISRLGWIALKKSK